MKRIIRICFKCRNSFPTHRVKAIRVEGGGIWYACNKCKAQLIKKWKRDGSKPKVLGSGDIDQSGVKQ